MGIEKTSSEVSDINQEEEVPFIDMKMETASYTFQEASVD
jgi:hypothetical protein